MIHKLITIREALDITPFLALLTYILRCIEASEQHLNSTPRLANYVRSLIRKLKRELDTCRTPAAGVR